VDPPKSERVFETDLAGLGRRDEAEVLDAGPNAHTGDWNLDVAQRGYALPCSVFDNLAAIACSMVLDLKSKESVYGFYGLRVVSSNQNLGATRKFNVRIPNLGLALLQYVRAGDGGGVDEHRQIEVASRETSGQSSSDDP